ncbi:MAG: TIGR04211 family SH3 domain-containing protein [Pseudomonadales bacterium]
MPRFNRERAPLRALTCSLVLTALMLAGPAPAALAASAYISDELTVPLRTGASNAYRILRVLPAGTRLDVRQRDTDAGYARVSTQDGTEGWVPLQYLQDQPIARDRLEAANREVQRLTQTVAELRQRLQALQGARSESEETNTSLTSEVARLEQELAEIRRAAAGAIETADANRRLDELNTRLRDELNLLVEERDRLETNIQQRWFMLGGGLVLLGLILGLTLKARPRRSGWS